MAEFLEADPRVAWVHYCGLPSDENYERGQKYLPNGSCGVMAFGLKGTRETAISFMDSLQMIAIVTHVADARTCVLHPASHTHRQLSDEISLMTSVRPSTKSDTFYIRECHSARTCKVAFIVSALHAIQKKLKKKAFSVNDFPIGVYAVTKTKAT